MKNQDYLRSKPFFWSRLGFCYDPPRYDKEQYPIVFSKEYDKYRRFHKDFENAGIRYHTTILHSGWVDDGVFDYRLTDDTLDGLLKDNPDILYMPRVKLNAPPGWCKKHPEEVFVYEKYKDLSLQEISDLCGTLEHDYFGFNCPEGYAVNGGIGRFKDDRPNVDGHIGLQSFSSEKWIRDASEALGRLIEHIQNGPYAKQVIGYHVAYGQCGETCLWGSWRGREEHHRGDFGMANRKAFISYGLAKYGSEEGVLKKWGFASIEEIEVPSVEVRDSAKSSMRELFYDTKHHLQCLDYNEFTSEANAKACEAFCKVVKEKTDGEAAAGIFYGYIYMPQSAYMSHCALDTVLNSPYIDFLASPKAYFRTLAGDPGGEQCPSYSINRKKVWLDEIDNWTHLDRRDGRAEDFFETRTLILREGVKNLSCNQGFWWMDLGEGWYDMPEIMELIEDLSTAQERINQKEHKSVSEILIVVDEKSIMSMSASYGLTGGLLYNLQSELRLCGAPVDTLRLADLYEIDLSQYKMIVFANAFKVDNRLREILKANAENTTYIWNYASGVLNPDFDMENIYDLTGFHVKEFAHNYGTEEIGYRMKPYHFGPVPELILDFPLVEILSEAEQKVISRYPDGRIMCAEAEKNGGTSVFCALASLMAEDFRKLALEAGCRMYAPVNCTVYADNRIMGVFPKEDVQFALEFGPYTVDGNNRKEISVKAKGAAYFIYD